MTTLPGTSTGQQSTGAPTVLTAGSVINFMVWTGLGPNTNWINFATAPTGSYVFPQGPYKSYSSNFGPAFVPIVQWHPGLCKTPLKELTRSRKFQQPALANLWKSIGKSFLRKRMAGHMALMPRAVTRYRRDVPILAINRCPRNLAIRREVW